MASGSRPIRAGSSSIDDVSAGPKSYDDPDRLADDLLAEIGKDIVLALPLGLGKANHIANVLYQRAIADRSISLRIFTALTLEKPKPTGELERRFIGPVIDRLFGGYPELAYASALRDGSLPDNIEVNEFFLVAGRLHDGRAAARSRPQAPAVRHGQTLDHPLVALERRNRRRHA